ncbi:hypothetical protein MBLNU459_g8099t1 [Dothideomycetes sp. NU459]
MSSSQNNTMEYDIFAEPTDGAFPDGNFDDFNYFELLPGLQASELPNFTFPGSLGDLTAFSPLERNSVSNDSAFIGWAKPKKGPASTGLRPLWLGQCRLLLTFFASFSGRPAIIRKAIESMGMLANDYRQRVIAVKADISARERQSWHRWIHRETSKRLLYGIFVLSNLLTITYGIPPAVSVVQDGEVELPDDEALWTAPTEEQWQQRMATRESHVPVSLRDAVSRLMYGKEPDVPMSSSWNWSPFAATMVMHAVSVQMWNMMQSTHSFSALSVQANVHESLKSMLTSQTEIALARCHAMITRERSEIEHTWTESEGPLIFNCLAVLRIAYVRSFTGIGSMNRMLLLGDDHSEIMRAIQDYVASPQSRGPFMSRAIAQAFEGFFIPIKAGMLLVQKTAALSWSIEHAIAGWDCALFLTKWTYAMEELRRQGIVLDQAEQQNLDKVNTLLAEVGINMDGKVSLAGELTRLWATFYDDTWVWGVTPRMGWVLRELATAYEDTNR